MTRPTIAIITPTHPARARSGKLGRAMRSVHEQTLLPDEVHVAIDLDGDGAAVTRTRALSRARTDWVAFLDSDDILGPRHLELCLRHALEHEADFVYSWFQILQERADGRTQVIVGDENGDGVFPLTHFLNDWDPANPIETTVTTLVRTELAQSVGFKELDRGHDQNSGEDAYFTLGCRDAGAKISHLKRKTWYWSHSFFMDGKPMNTSGRPTKGDAVRDS